MEEFLAAPSTIKDIVMAGCQAVIDLFQAVL